MKIDCISDLHGEQPKLEGGDLLIIAGDLTASDQLVQYEAFCDWLSDVHTYYEKIVVIAGNHEGAIYNGYFDPNDFDATYLQDSGCEFGGYKIWGSPWTPTFCNWYFMKPRGEELAKVWAKIPLDTDILVTHGPPFGILDYVGRGTRRGVRCGCEDLRLVLDNLSLKLHVFGHIHGGYGIKVHENERVVTQFVNASVMNEDYEMVNNPITVNL